MTIRIVLAIRWQDLFKFDFQSLMSRKNVTTDWVSKLGNAYGLLQLGIAD